MINTANLLYFMILLALTISINLIHTMLQAIIIAGSSSFTYLLLSAPLMERLVMERLVEEDNATLPTNDTKYLQQATYKPTSSFQHILRWYHPVSW